MTSSEGVALHPALKGVLGELFGGSKSAPRRLRQRRTNHLSDPSALVGRQGIPLHVSVRRFEHSVELVRCQLVRREDAVRVGVLLDRVGQVLADGLHARDVLLALLVAKLFPVAQLERLVSVVGLLEEAEATLLVARETGLEDVAEERLVGLGGRVEELLGVVGLEPLLEMSELLVVSLGGGEGDLVGGEAARGSVSMALTRPR